MKEHMIAYMKKLFEAGHAEPVPLPTGEQECWYLYLWSVSSKLTRSSMGSAQLQP